MIAELETRRATLAPESLDREAGTVEVTLSTGAAVRRAGYVERLAIAPDAVALAPRIPLLDSHRQGSIADIKGRVENVRFEAGRIIATLRVSDPRALDAIERGDVTGVSIGYRVDAWKDSRGANGERVREAANWTLVEASLVAVPADPEALIRSQTMTEATAQTAENPAPANAEVIETRAAIREIAKRANLPAEWADTQIDGGADIVAVRAAAFEEMAKRSPAPIRTATVGASNEDPAIIRRRQADALAARMTGGAPSDEARLYMAASLRDIAADALTRSGVSTRLMSPDEIFTRAAHGTSDFPLVVSNAMNKVALETYRAAESPLKSLCRQRSLPNFKESTSIRLGEMGRLEELSEHGEITHTSRAENGETMRLKTFARGITVTRRLLIDDDLNLLGDITAAMGEAAAQTEADILTALIVDNPNLADGTAVFDASRDNIGTAGGPSINSLAEARKSMRLRKGLDEKTIISAAPRFVVVGAGFETLAEQVLASIQPNKADDVNPFSGALSLLVEPRLPSTAWYVFSDPGRLASLQFAYLAAAQGVQIQQTEAWDTLGMKYRAFLDFGAGWLDWRGAHQVPAT